MTSEVICCFSESLKKELCVGWLFVAPVLEPLFIATVIVV